MLVAESGLKLSCLCSLGERKPDGSTVRNKAFSQKSVLNLRTLCFFFFFPLLAESARNKLPDRRRCSLAHLALQSRAVPAKVCVPPVPSGSSVCVSVPALGCSVSLLHPRASEGAQLAEAPSCPWGCSALTTAEYKIPLQSQ